MENEQKTVEPAISLTNLAKSMKDQVNKPEEKQAEYHLNAKDFKALKKSKYHQKQHEFNESFVIENTKTGSVVELKAASSIHAARLIGWKPRNVRLLETRTVETKTY